MYDKPDYSFEVTGSRSLVAHFQNVTGIAQYEDIGNIRVFPIPADKTLTIASEVYMEEVSLVDALGRQLYHALIDGSTYHEVDVSTEHPGIYFLRVRTKQGVSTHRIVISN